jgi:uncharacterized protein YraI
MKRFLCALLLLLGIAGTASAQVVNGVVTTYVDLYAGPDVGYPTIAQLPAGTPVAIQGCITGWTWCDVVTMGMRGWVAGTFVQYTYQSQPVVVADYGARIGIPIVAFSIGLYWDNYYRNRPFYRNRDYWYSRPYVPRPPPRPPGYRPGYRPPAPGHRPPPGPRPPSDHRPPSGGDHRPSPGPAPRPPSPDHRPPPSQGHRPAPGPGTRPPPQANRPPQGGAPRPSAGQNQGHGHKPPQGNPGNRGNEGH